ncbi:MAG: hypothetical protein NT150_10510 [Bacteroidetes bacterium]|nr:hypothetical protein [Bacteroidota bacterium]
METSSFNKVFSLQSGEYCHFYNELVVINDRTLVEKRDLNMDMNKTADYKKLRLAVNVLFTLSILTMVIITGFYPLALLVFVSVWNLKNIKRQNLPTLVSDCFPVKNISSARFIGGKLGFNEIDLTIVNDQGKEMTKVLKLYDSKEETMKAIGIFQHLGLIQDNPLDINKTILVNQKSFKISATENLYVLENEVVISKKNEYPERGEFVGINNIIFLFVQLLLTGAICIKTYQTFIKDPLHVADFVVILLLLLLYPLPFKYFNKSTADLIQRKDVLKTYIQEKKGKNTLVIEFKSDWYFPLKRKILFEDAAEAKAALDELK